MLTQLALVVLAPSASRPLVGSYRRHAPARCWTGETSATLQIEGVPVPFLYEQYADLSRMTEWSPLLDSVTVDPLEPGQAVWGMRIPRALKHAARNLGYPDVLSWEADLEAPGPPDMNWTSTLDENGRLKGLPEAGTYAPTRVLRPRCPYLCGHALDATVELCARSVRHNMIHALAARH